MVVACGGALHCLHRNTEFTLWKMKVLVPSTYPCGGVVVVMFFLRAREMSDVCTAYAGALNKYITRRF
jgi:hypothetical protein